MGSRKGEPMNFRIAVWDNSLSHIAMKVAKLKRHAAAVPLEFWVCRPGFALPVTHD